MKSLNNKVTTVQVHDELTRQFEYVNSLIERHRFNAITKVNIEVLLTSWEVGEYISIQLKTSRYASLMNKDKMLSPKLLSEYPKTEFMLKDKAFVDFLNLPEVHNEQHLHKGLLEHIKDFILELGKHFLFVESEFRVQVGGTTKRIDLLFYHRALQCLVAIELKTVDFQPEFIGKMDLYLEALDRDVKRDNENPSIGIILCPSADRSIVEYTLSRSLSPTMVAEYKRKLIPIEVMRKSLEEYCEFLNNR